MRVAGGGRDGGETWFFFPAYDFTYRTVFEGVAFAREDAGNFLGLYRVADEAQPLLLPCLTLHEPGEPERLCAGLETPCDPMRLFTPENEWVQIAEAGVLAERMGRLNEAVFYTRVANALRPSSEMAGKIALLYEQAGQTQNTLRVLESAVVSSGGDITSCIALEKFLGRKAREFSAPSVWEQLVRQMPTIPVWQAYERSLDEKEVEKRLSVLRQLLRVAPEDGGALLKLQKLLVEEGARMEAQGDLPGAVKAYREAIPLNPRNNEPVLCLEKALSNSGPAERQSVWEAAWADNRDNPHVATLCGAARAASGDLAGAKEAFDTARRLAPEEWYYHVLAADALAAAGAWADAAAAYGRALAINPKLDYLRSRLDEAETRVENETRPPESAAPPPAAP
jgi:tetratricopeptide (TPR) repeat protein